MITQVEVYKAMLRSRLFEEKVRRLFSEGGMYGTTHLNIGQEASHVGLCNALGDEDWIVPTHRCHGFNIAATASTSPGAVRSRPCSPNCTDPDMVCAWA